MDVVPTAGSVPDRVVIGDRATKVQAGVAVQMAPEGLAMNEVVSIQDSSRGAAREVQKDVQRAKIILSVIAGRKADNELRVNRVVDSPDRGATT